MLTRLVGEYGLDFEWRGFELHPQTPRGGMLVSDLFRGASLDAMTDQMKRFAAGFGVEMGLPARMPNTRRVLAVAERARDEGRLDPFRQAAMEAHWNQARDLEDDAVLEALVVQAGLDARIAEAADDPVYQARVDDMGREAVRWGVTGIPTYFFLPEGWDIGDPAPPRGDPRPSRVVGCQSREIVAEACERAGARRLD